MSIALRPLLFKREATETWLHDLAARGDCLVDFQLVFFQSAIVYTFEQKAPNQRRFYLYELRNQDELELWTQANWQVIKVQDRFVIFYSDDCDVNQPLVYLSPYIWRRFLKTLCNFLYIFGLFMLFRNETTYPFVSLWVCTFSFFTLPNALGIQASGYEAKGIRIIKNIVIALVSSFVIAFVFDWLITSIRSFL